SRHRMMMGRSARSWGVDAAEVAGADDDAPGDGEAGSPATTRKKAPRRGTSVHGPGNWSTPSKKTPTERMTPNPRHESTLPAATEGRMEKITRPRRPPIPISQNRDSVE